MHEETRQCFLCGDEYVITELLADTCPDCLDNHSDLEDLLDAALKVDKGTEG